MKTKLLPLLILSVILIVGFTNYLVLGNLTNINSHGLPEAGISTKTAITDSLPTVHIGVISRFAPNVIFAGYQPIMDYLNRHGQYRYELKLSTSYQDAVDRLLGNEVEASFLGAWLYGHLNSTENLVPVAAPVNSRGNSEFHAVLVTRPGSGVESVAHLKGKKVALPSAQSWSGNWLQFSALADFGLHVADLDSLYHFDHHQTVVWQVLMGNFDVGVVKESVAAKYQSEGLRTVIISTPIPGPPLVTRKDVDPLVVAELSQLLLALKPENPADKMILDSWTQEFSQGFTSVSRQQYLDAFTAEGRSN